jgi:endonuclease YncB( thermonuclease family)
MSFAYAKSRRALALSLALAGAIGAGTSLAGGLGCGPLGGGGRHRYLGTQAERDLGRLEQAGLVIGEFHLAPKAIVDGDTIKVSGLDSSLRLLGLDCEETFKRESERRAFESSTWAEYLAAGRGGSTRPVKLPTPLGEDAKHFAEEFFRGASVVRLERDHPKEIRDYFNRYLAYVLVERDGRWLNYNVECVRAGMSPYFAKYGYSRRYHAEFVRAQAEARTAGRGIWAKGAQHYDDYDERLAWWTERAEQIAAFERAAQGKAEWIVLTRWDAWQAIEAHEGEVVWLLGSVADVRLGDRGPSIVTLSRRLKQDFKLVFFDKDVLGTSGITGRVGEFVAVRGTITRYRDKKRNRDELQMIVDLPGQVRVPGAKGWDVEP